MTRVHAAAACIAYPVLCHAAVVLFDPPVLLLGILPVALFLALSALFGATLLGEREPMVTRFARADHGGSLPEDLRRYTRMLTFLWSAFFAAMASASAYLALWGSAHAWSLFTNVFSYLAVAAFFAAEYAFRRLRFPHHRHLSPAQILRRLHTYRVLPP